MKTKVTVRKLHNLSDSVESSGWYWLVSALTAKHLGLKPTSLAQNIAFAIDACAYEAKMSRAEFMAMIQKSLDRVDARVKAEHATAA